MRSALLAAALFVTAQQGMLSQTALSMPSWLANYPGATAEARTLTALTESSYTTAALPEDVVAHYAKLFEAAKLPFVPNFDGSGTSIRAAAAECDLLIAIREASAGTFVKVSCAAKSASSPASAASPDVVITTGSRSRNPPPAWGRSGAAESLEHYKRTVAELGIHPVYHDSPAPPLVWPSWLVHMKGARLAIQQGVNDSKRDYLKCTFVTSAPMTQIHVFYEDLLNANGYRVYGSRLSTGQTISGIVQNANGYVEGANYPQGTPGPSTVIHVSFSRFHLNDPISVDLRMSTYPFVASKHSWR